MLGYPFCPAKSLNRGPGLLSIRSRVIKIIELTHILSAGLTPEGTVQSCCVILGFITQSKYLYGALREAYLPKFQVFLLLEPPSIPVGFALRKLPSSLASWTHP